MEASALTPFVGRTGRPRALVPTPLVPTRESDECLLARVRAGESLAFEALYARYRRELVGYCRRMLGSSEDAEDVLQEVFAAAYRAMLADQRPINCRPWLYRIAHNRCLNELSRRRQTEQLPAGDRDPDICLALGDSGAPAEQFDRKEQLRLLVGDIGELPPAQRTALVLRAVDGRSYDEIAEATDASVAGVRSLLHRARQGLTEAGEARELPCAEVRSVLVEADVRGERPSARARRHVKHCEPCLSFTRGLTPRPRRTFAAILPLGPLVALRRLLLAKLGSGGAAGCGPAATSGAVGSSGTAVSACGGGTGLGLTAGGLGGVSVKVVAGLAAVAAAGVGTVAIQHHPAAQAHRAGVPGVAAAASPSIPLVPVSLGAPGLGTPAPRSGAATRAKRLSALPLQPARSRTGGATRPGGGTSTSARTLVGGAGGRGTGTQTKSGSGPSVRPITGSPSMPPYTVRTRPGPRSPRVLMKRTRPTPPSPPAEQQPAAPAPPSTPQPIERQPAVPAPPAGSHTSP